ncbi:hypothetical protein G5I_02910 [Acromyrmex echinatior]|uniref:Uncharacterized protein n=1 Tax=Acromyrmex echinatior TaxID=103372 RepID=F4WBJ7_ACREC|nr:hypothetical protein G5I_02910 [Acromyrmex echinatior]
MEESQTSESVAVLPDMSEPLTSETEEAATLTSEHEAHPVAVTASVTTVSGVPGVPGVGVPVSLPVGSIIGVANSTNGTTFNVITSDQLQTGCSKRPAAEQQLISEAIFTVASKIALLVGCCVQSELGLTRRKDAGTGVRELFPVVVAWRYGATEINYNF